MPLRPPRFIPQTIADYDRFYRSVAVEPDPNSVGSTEIRDAGVIEQKIASLAVTAPKIAVDAVTETKLASGSVTSTKIADASVTTSKIAVADADGKVLIRRSGAMVYDTLQDADIPATVARDSEVTTAIATHEAAPDPHTVYALEAAMLASGTLALTGIISPAQLIANTDNYNPTGLATATVLRLSTDVSRNLTGIVAAASARVLVVFNVGAQDLVLVNDSTSTAANRFLFGANITLGAEEGISLWYDTTSSRWRSFGKHV